MKKKYDHILTVLNEKLSHSLGGESLRCILYGSDASAVIENHESHEYYNLFFNPEFENEQKDTIIVFGPINKNRELKIKQMYESLNSSKKFLIIVEDILSKFENLKFPSINEKTDLPIDYIHKSHPLSLKELAFNITALKKKKYD